MLASYITKCITYKDISKPRTQGLHRNNLLDRTELKRQQLERRNSFSKRSVSTRRLQHKSYLRAVPGFFQYPCSVHNQWNETGKSYHLSFPKRTRAIECHYGAPLPFHLKPRMFPLHELLNSLRPLQLHHHCCYQKHF